MRMMNQSASLVESKNTKLLIFCSFIPYDCLYNILSLKIHSHRRDDLLLCLRVLLSTNDSKGHTIYKPKIDTLRTVSLMVKHGLRYLTSFKNFLKYKGIHKPAQ